MEVRDGEIHSRSWLNIQRDSWTRTFLSTGQLPALPSTPPDPNQGYEPSARLLTFGDVFLSDRLIREAYALDKTKPLPSYWQTPKDEIRDLHLQFLREEEMEGPWAAT